MKTVFGLCVQIKPSKQFTQGVRYTCTNCKAHGNFLFLLGRDKRVYITDLANSTASEASVLVVEEEYPILNVLSL